MRISTLFAGITILLLLSSQGISQYLATESFDYPNGSDFDGPIGDATNGWGGPWEQFDGNFEVMTVTDDGMDYSKLDYDVPRAGLQISGANPLAWQYQRYGRYLAQPWPDQAGTDYWISFLIELANGFTDNGWAGIGLYDSTAIPDEQERQLLGHEWGSPLYGIGTYDDAGRSSFSWDSGPQWMVVRIMMSGDAEDERAFLWVSPDPAEEPDTTSANARGNLGSLNNGFNRIVVHFGGEGVGMSMSVDEIRLGTSFEDVSGELATSVSQPDNEIPVQFALEQNYPNPFNPDTRISYKLEDGGQVRLSVFDLLGKEVAVLVDGVEDAGRHQVVFTGDGLASGVYFYRLWTLGGIQTRKMMLMQ